MISNNSASKLKASRSTRDFDFEAADDCEPNQSGRFGSRPRSDTDSSEGRLHNTVIFSPKDGRGKPRTRPTEFRGYRGQPTDRRGSGRSRPTYSSKGDRETSDSTLRRFQEPLTKHGSTESNVNSHYKYGSSKYDSDVKSSFIYALPEDPRISKLLRRLCGESDVEKSLAICSKLQEAIMLPDNARYIRRSYDILAESLLDVLYDAPGSETKIQVAASLGRIGFVMGTDYRKHLDWVMGKYTLQRIEEVKVMLILSFCHLFQLDAEQPSFGEYASGTMSQLQGVIEATDSAKIFTVAIDAIIILSKSYPEAFAKHFIDMVDILVGWHVDAAQPKKVKVFAVKTLEKLSCHWRADLVFSVKLLGQFLEDMVAYGEDLVVTSQTNPATVSDEPLTDPEGCIQRITSFINVFNTVAKSLGEMLSPNFSPSISWVFLTESFLKMIKTLLRAIKVDCNNELVAAGNECTYLFLDYLQTKISSNCTFLYELINIELSNCLTMSDEVKITMLNLIRKTVKEISSNLPIEFIKAVIGRESNLLNLRISHNQGIQETVISVYQSILNLKNIPLLQEAYRYVLEDIELCYVMFVPGVDILSRNSPECRKMYKEYDAETILLFNLQCLTDIANASNSIIGMWALQPSILELLAVKLKPYDQTLSLDNPALQYAIIYLLYSHCKNNNHFIVSSDLVTLGQQRANVRDILGISNINLGEVSTSSPTSGHFGIILSLFNNLFQCKLPTDTLVLLLKWTSEIFIQLEKYFPAVFHCKVLIDLLINSINAGFSLNIRIIQGVAINMDILMKNRNIPWNNIVMRRLGELCLIHLDNSDNAIRQQYTTIISYIPWDIIILDLIKSSDIKTEKYRASKALQLNKTNIISAQKEHMTRYSCGQMSALHFKTFMGYLLNNNSYNDGWLNDSFTNCWPLRSPEGVDSHLTFFRQSAQCFGSVLTMWATWEAAQLCTALKLRTPLGKPQETFTSIECAIKQLARELTINSVTTLTEHKGATETRMVDDLKRSRMLIEFLEFLEKAIHNAAEGCATIMLPVNKFVRSFFHTNSLTCREWVSRVRPAALLVALHSGHAAAVVRHAHSLLHVTRPASDSAISLPPELLTYTISLARALLQLKEPEAIIGVYAWIKKTYHINLFWLKAAAEQGYMRYESAVGYYLRMIQENEIKKDDDPEKSETDSRLLDDREKKFINDQITECYKSVQCWPELLKWKDSDIQLSLNEVMSTDKHMINILCYHKFQDDEIIFPEELCDWDIFKSSKEVCNQDWSCFQIFERAEMTLKNVALKVMFEPDYLVNATQSIEQCIAILQSSLSELSRNQPSEFINDSHILHYAAIGLKKIVIDRKLQINPFFLSTERPSLKNVDPTTLSKILWWSDYFSKLNSLDIDVPFMENMRLDMVKASRKHGNFTLSKRELVKYFGVLKHFQNFSDVSIKRLEDVYDVLVRSTNTYDMNIWSFNNIVAIMETSKLLHANEETREMAINLCASASLGVSQRLTLGDHTYEFRERGTRMLLTLSKWVQSENDRILINNLNSPLTKLVTALPEIGLVNNNVSANVIPILDSAVGKLLQFSVNQCPGLAKAWFTFGSWCFRWGKKMVEYSSNERGQLTENDKLQIQNVMLLGNAEDFDIVCEILSKTRVTCDDEDIDWNEINTSEIIECQLRSVPSLRNFYPEHLILLVDIWRQAQKRVFSYYELSADAYFKFLELSSASENINHNGECAIVIATLRLLRLIVKHAMELQNVLESGLANTPTQPWKVIIPQLFSRLNHPENYVRRRVSELLCRLAEDTPHLITFPAVVGAVENEKINLADLSFPKSIFAEGDNNELEIENDSDTSDTESEKDNDLNSCFMDMVDTLSKQAPETILQVQLLVKELRRINLLWDELWLRTLAQHHSEITRRLAQLDIEILKVKNNVNLSPEEKERLISEKHRIILKPILFVLEQLAEITSATPETPHEVNFREKFYDSINEMLEKLKNPPEPDKPQESWLPIKQLQTKLQQKFNKRSYYALKMSDISPTLAKMTDTVISMPGVHTCFNVRVTIMSINNTVAILPTKTNPKKLIFHGSDGKTYTYLFKGLEDLHLDERIMQFLSITNTMMAHDREDNLNQTYRARHYSVIPLGPRSGLISWVDNLTPLFALYKRWQQREAVTLSVKSNKSVMVLRPSEVYYKKLTPLLNKAGVATDNRKEWPASILKQVLTELMAETPKDLLAKELWCLSVTPGQWWRTVRRYSFSVAVMSTIGYIIGLGDRHLDNVLVDLSTGEVVHIDYNVCFEKGKTLRVPEKVPFRMTPNLEQALGVTGVEGIFRLACEHVLKTAKRGRETLLTLLEAFVYDPLVEWGGEAGAGAGAAGRGARPHSASGRRARLERRLARDMLAVRLAEARHDWADSREEMLQQVRQAASLAGTRASGAREAGAGEARLQAQHRQLGLARELQALGPALALHPLCRDARDYSAYRRAEDALEESAASLRELRDECAANVADYALALDTIKGPQLARWLRELDFPIDHDGHLVFDLVRDFLTNAGQSSAIAQCERSERELGQCARQRASLVKASLELLARWAGVVQFYPQSFLDGHRTALCREWAGVLLETDSPEVCRDVLAQIQSRLASDGAVDPGAQQAAAFSRRLRAASDDADAKLSGLCERLRAEGGAEASPRCERNFADAKAAVAAFAAQGCGSGEAAECAVISALCALNGRYLMLESGAQSAGDCLVDLTSRDGEWFLDEMSVISSLVTELTAYVPLRRDSSPNDDRIPAALERLRAARAVFVDLQELSRNFQTIILPEAIKKIQAEEPSVLLMINELNSAVLNTACPLSELLAQLEMHLRYIIMEMDSPSGNAQLIAADLRARYSALGAAGPGPGAPSAGRMLLMGSDGLLAPLAGRGAALLDALATLRVPPSWTKVDQIREAKDLAAPLHNDRLRSILDDIFFIKRIQALTEFFSLSVQMSCAFKGVGAATFHDDERLYKPVKRFMADYVGRQFLGVQSQWLAITICLLLQRLGLNVNKEIEQRDIGLSWKVSLEELCELCTGNAMKNGLFGPSTLQQAGALVANLDAAFRRRENTLVLERQGEIAAACSARLRLQATAHNWLRCEGRAAGGGGAGAAGAQGAQGTPGASTSGPPTAELRKTATQLAALQPRLAAALDKHRSLVASVQQRLKWAAGANPALASVLASFECAVHIREDRLGVERALAVGVGATAAALAAGAGEAGRTLPLLAHRRRQALALAARAPPPPPALHRALLQLRRPDPEIDTLWVNNVTTQISEMITQLQKHLADLKANLSTSEEALKKAAVKLATCKSTHERLISDAESLLKSIAKTQEGAAVHDYLLRHNTYMEQLARFLDGLTSEEMTEEDVVVLMELATNLEQDTPGIYDDLISFEGAWQGEEGAVLKRRSTLVRQAAQWTSPARQTSPPKNRVSQQQNAYAASVWKRVRLKLEGRDPDSARKHSNQEQVEYIINEAMSLDNLCLLYEGWTPWV